MAIACAASMIEHMYVDLQAGCLRYDEGQPKLLMCKSTPNDLCPLQRNMQCFDKFPIA
jgi:hypothetical protein